MNKIVIACDSFKESMTAIEACNAIKNGIREVDSLAECICIPMADGGEGTTEVLMNTFQAEKCYLKIHDPFGKMINAYYGLNSEGIAIMEVASSCGIHLIPREQRDPTRALSIGLGEMIKSAIEKGAKKIIIGLGGSGTNDGGYGMLCSLGAKFYDANNQLLPIQLDSINKIYKIDLNCGKQLLKNCEIIVASDVDNVFTGEDGATFVFGKQKGATKLQIEYLENTLINFQNIINKQYKINLKDIKKTGAAGGLGGSLYLLDAKMMSGIELILDVTNFEKIIQDADYIMTGEGSVDFQTINGKTISGIAKIASKYHIPVIVFAGKVSKDACNIYDIGVTSMFSIINEVKSLEQALRDGKDSLQFTAKNAYKLIMKR